MKKIVSIVGPTGSGKSSLGIKLAQLYNGEIISGDSIQVYKELDIGSAKVTKKEQELIKHYLIDILPINDHYDVASFQKNARKLINQISENNKLPFIVGGTGLYIKAVLYDYLFPKTEPLNLEEYEKYTNEELKEQLKIKDYNEYLKIHQNNRKRLIRAVALADSGNKRSDSLEKQNHELIYDAKIIGLTLPREQLYERINNRVDLMIKDGLFEEIKGLYEKYPDLFDYQSMQGIGYREWKDYFFNNETKENVIDNIKKHSRQFAKRQYTWFNNQMPIDWYDITENNWEEKIIEDIKKWK